MILLSSIIKTFEAEFLAHYQDSILPSQRKALVAMKQCRTTQSPVMLAQCEAPVKSTSRILAAIATVLTVNSTRASNGWSANSKNKCRPSIF